MWKQQQGRLRNKEDTYLFPFQTLLTFITIVNANITSKNKKVKLRENLGEKQLSGYLN